MWCHPSFLLSPHTPSLPRIADEGIVAITDAVLTNSDLPLEFLDISYNSFFSRGIDRLVRFAHEARYLRKLYLNGNEVSLDDMRRLAKVAVSRQIDISARHSTHPEASVYSGGGDGDRDDDDDDDDKCPWAEALESAKQTALELR